MAVKKQIQTDDYSLYLGDCCKVLPELPSDKIGYSIFSPPFSSLYSYSDKIEDMGNCKTHKEFFEHFEFLAKELYRVMMPGRIVSVHCMELPIHKKEGEDIGVYDFPGDIIRLFNKIGFIFHCRFCIWKDPLIAAVRTKAIGLAHKQIVKNSAICRTGLPDYILCFRKPGENTIPITHKEGLKHYYGHRHIPKDLDRFLSVKEQKKNKRSHWIWQQYASPVWFDIRQTKVLPYREAKDGDDEKHICPLQLDVIERCLVLWSNENDIVLTPFMGVGSEAYVAVKRFRKAIGIELKESYYKQATRNIKYAIKKRTSERLF